MLFNSIEFYVFLPIIFLLYWFVFKKQKKQNVFVILASYVFYGWWDWRFLLLIAFTSLFSYLCGILIDKQQKNNKTDKGKKWLVCNIVINVLILGLFKYFNFFSENFAALFGSIEINLDWPTLNLVLPVGISFYTFSAISYTIDVYRKDIAATYDAVAFLAFVSFFPKLIAGPIERAKDLLPQFQKDRVFAYETAIDGSKQMLWGFFKKLVIADNCAFVVNSNWGRFDELTGITLFVMGVLYTFQIYCDFSGYSDIAIGCAKLFGIRLKKNFNYPYFSRDISEFWRKWHISLMTWFRDYIYFPLGGSKCARWKVIRNTLIVFAISGLWHGANWTFIVWGIYHAFLIILFMYLGLKMSSKTSVAQGKFLPSVGEMAKMILTFFFVVIGWIIFRAESMFQAWAYLTQMFATLFTGFDLQFGLSYLIVGFALIFVEWFVRDKEYALQFPDFKIFKYKGVRWAVYYFLFYAVFEFAGNNQSFIYTQF